MIPAGDNAKPADDVSSRVHPGRDDEPRIGEINRPHTVCPIALDAARNTSQVARSSKLLKRLDLQRADGREADRR
jgi:hypothetical protein